jgi:hypothetical protein
MPRCSTWLQFAKYLACAWNALSPASKIKISRCQGRKINRTRRAILKFKSAAKITLSEEIRQVLPLWKASPSTFLNIQDVLKSNCQNNPLVYIYKVLSTLDADVPPIQRRILMLIICELKDNVCQRINGNALQHITEVICQSGLVTGKYEYVLDKISKWALAGARYKQLAHDLGGLGALILLPNIGATTYVNLDSTV